MNAGRQDPGYVDRRTDTTEHGGLLSTSRVHAPVHPVNAPPPRAACPV